MADGNQLKRVDPVDFSEDDPFAELTRIMGFDPRESETDAAHGQGAGDESGIEPTAPETAAADAEPDLPSPDLPSEDFGIDLERELLGEFAIEDEPAADQAAPVRDDGVDEAAIAAELENVDGADLDFELDLDDAFEAVAADEAVEDVAVASDEPTMPMVGEFVTPAENADTDDTITPIGLSTDGSAGAGEPDEVVENTAASETPGDAPVAGTDTEPAETALAISDDELVADLDLDSTLAAELDSEFSLDPADPDEEAAEAVADEDWDLEDTALLAEASYADQAEADAGEAETDEVQAEADAGEVDPEASFDADEVDADAAMLPQGNPAAVAVGPAGDDIDLDLDIAMAEVDMDFGGEALDAEVAAQIHADELDAAAVGQSSVAAEPSLEQVESAPESANDAPSLEDELNALLGNFVPRAELAGGYDGSSTPFPASDDASNGTEPDSVANGEQGGDVGAPESEDVSAAADYAGPSYEIADATYEADEVDEVEEISEPDLSADPVVEFDDEAFDDEVFDDRLDADENSASEHDGVAEPQPYLAADPAVEFDDEMIDERMDQDPYDAEREEPAANEYEAHGAEFEETYAAEQPMDQAAVPDHGDDFDLSPMNPEPLGDTPEAEIAGQDGIDDVPEPRSASASMDVPDIETVDVPESSIAVEDDLDIPELNYEDDVVAAPLDDFESDFATAFTDPVRETKAQSYMSGGVAAPSDAGEPDDRTEARADYGYAAGTIAMAQYGSARAADDDHGVGDDAMDDLAGDYVADHDARDTQDYDNNGMPAYDEDDEDVFPGPIMAPIPEEPARPQRRGMLIAAIVGGVAIVGIVGAFALSPGSDGGSTTPVLVRADDSPIKVRPEKPGGTIVPNQDNSVYEAVAGTEKPAAPEQKTLITSVEEPVDVEAPVEVQTPVDVRADDSLPGVAGLPDEGSEDVMTKSEDRIVPASDSEASPIENPEVAAVAPRRVRTMLVRADGTLVPREETTATTDATPAEPQAGADALPIEPASTSSAATVATGATASDEIAAKPLQKPADNAAGTETASLPLADTTTALKPAIDPSATSTPATVPVAPSRPADQPVDIVGEVKPDQVAATGPAAGPWSVQIASQPSEQAAKVSYASLASRYSNVIGGKGVTIVKAEIAGKGTYWRVRVPAGSRNAAINLCENYKSAGGNCFVSK